MMSNKPQFVGEKVRLGDVCTVVSGATPKTKTEEYWGGVIKWITPAELSDDSHYVSDTEKHLTDAGFKNANLHMMPKGTVLLTTRAPIGKIAIATEEMCCNQGFKNLICSEAINNEFLFRYLKSQTTKLQAMGRGATFKELSKKDVAEFRINLPTLTRQLEAVDKLTAVENQLMHARSQLNRFDSLVKSRFVEMFGRVEDEHLDFPVKTLDDVCASIVRGPFGSALRKEFFVPKGPGTYKVYEQKHAIQKKADIGTYYISSDRFETLKRFECHPCDILMSCSGTMGEFYQLPANCEPGVMNQALCKFTLSDSILVDFFLGFMEQVVGKLGANGSSIKNVSSVKFIKAIRIPVPPVELQKQFTAFVAQVDKSRFAYIWNRTKSVGQTLSGPSSTLAIQHVEPQTRSKYWADASSLPFWLSVEAVLILKTPRVCVLILTGQMGAICARHLPGVMHGTDGSLLICCELKRKHVRFFGEGCDAMPAPPLVRPAPSPNIRLRGEAQGSIIGNVYPLRNRCAPDIVAK